jgi:hypothetical protein
VILGPIKQSLNIAKCNGMGCDFPKNLSESGGDAPAAMAIKSIHLEKTGVKHHSVA